MCHQRLRWLIAFSGLVLAAVPSLAPADPEPKAADLRERVLRADSRSEAADAYKAYFLCLGRSGVKSLTKDENLGIALQAAWETHLKPVKRKEKVDSRSDDVYDPAELVQFVTFLKDRTKAPIPPWWSTGVTDVDLFPGEHHAFIGPSKRGRDDPEKPKKGDEKKELQIKVRGDNLVCSLGGRSIEFPKDTFGESNFASFVGSIGEKRSVVASYPGISGFAYTLAGFEGKGGKPVWRADVWSAGRDFLGGEGYHRVEMTEKDGVVYLFGMESHGAYVEAFDASSGKVRFRFCTCYWFKHSEAWGLK